jgi:Gas vesicle synthesis protein GvpO
MADRKSPDEIIERVHRVLDDLGDMEVERVTGVEVDDDGWRVNVEVLEMRRIPDTADILAKYEVRLTSGGQFLGYRQVGRRLRGQLEDAP